MNFKKVFSTVAVASMLVGCGGGTSGGSTGGTALKEGDTVKIGFIGPLAGDNSVYGIPVAKSIQLAIDDYNKATDSKYKAELVKQDTQGKTEEAVNCYNKLVGDGVVGIVGPVLTGEALAVGNASEKNGTPIVTSSASGDTVTLKADKTTRDNFFRTCSNDSHGGQFIASKIGDGTIKVKKIAVLTNSDSDYSIGCTESFLEQAKNDNLKIVSEQKYPAAQADFSTYVDQIKSSGADAVFIPDYYDVIAKIVNKFDEKGFKGTYLGTDGWDGVLSVTNVDKSIFNGAYYTNTFDDRVDAVKDYVKAYKKVNNNENTNMFGTMAYDATWVLLKAVEKAGITDPAAVCKALSETDYTGITGRFQYDEQHNPTKDLVVKTIKNGSYDYLD